MRLLRKLATAYELANEYCFLPIFGVFGRVIFGNNAGFLKNLWALYELRRYHSPSLSHQYQPEKSFFKQFGYLKVQLSDLSLVKKLAIDAEKVFSAKKGVTFQGHPPHRESSMAINQLLNTFPYVKDILSPDIRELVRELYGTDFYVESVRLWRNAHVPNVSDRVNVYSNQWHNDQFNPNIIKLFVYLSEKVTCSSGAFVFHDIPFTKKIMRCLGYWRRGWVLGNSKKLMFSSRQHMMEGERGMAFIVQPGRCLHRASVPDVGTHRDLLQFTIYPCKKTVTHIWESVILNDTFRK